MSQVEASVALNVTAGLQTVPMSLRMSGGQPFDVPSHISAMSHVVKPPSADFAALHTWLSSTV